MLDYGDASHQNRTTARGGGAGARLGATGRGRARRSRFTTYVRSIFLFLRDNLAFPFQALVEGLFRVLGFLIKPHSCHPVQLFPVMM